MSMVIDMYWPIRTPGRIPLQHQYHLLSAISRVVPEVHTSTDFGIHAIRGFRSQPGVLDITEASGVRIRMPVDKVAMVLPLNGKKLELANCPVRLGIAQLYPLKPGMWLRSHVVTIKGYLEPESFSKGVRRQLDNMGIDSSIQVEIGPRRVLNVKEQTIVGFQVELKRLQEQDSLILQAKGLGGRRHLGCGLFNPAVPNESELQGGIKWPKQ